MKNKNGDEIVRHGAKDINTQLVHRPLMNIPRETKNLSFVLNCKKVINQT